MREAVGPCRKFENEKNKASDYSESSKMRKTELPTTRKAQKWKKQSFQLLGKLENEKNRASNYLEGSKMRKTELPTTWKAQKWEKQSFQLLGRLESPPRPSN
ncbi:hypothetical protein J5A66_04825 [Prevotella sp. oral taxon 475]|uniref:hypothetical protein n=1 Tax=Prevotella sp. oral taxon 475 TaxID=712471 RepID=UPI001BAE230B|nr:hypothetical protein [Prevotella sp. oral taxon 475]QUB48098.1 hypothetical protein J5A66_04825 [Prevotella sp. oral taxon 475]